MGKPAPRTLERSRVEMLARHPNCASFDEIRSLAAEVFDARAPRAWINGFATALESVLSLSHDEQAVRHACRAAGLRLIDFARADVNPPTLAKLEAILAPDRDVTTAPKGGKTDG